MATTKYELDTSETYIEGRGVVTDNIVRSDDADPQLGASVGFSSFDIPQAVTPGQQYNIGGDVFLDCVVGLTRVDTRVTIEVSGAGESRTVSTGKLDCGQSSSFSVDYTAPAAPGQTIDVTIKGELNPPGPLTGWTVTNTERREIQVVSQSEETQMKLIGYAPYLVGGGGGGYLLARNQGANPAAGALAGATIGAGAKRANIDIPTPGDFVPDQSTLVVSALALGAGAWFLTRAQDVTGVGEGAGGAVTRVARGAGRTTKRLASAASGSDSSS